mgnify:CR=1 FL=1
MTTRAPFIAGWFYVDAGLVEQTVLDTALTVYPKQYSDNEEDQKPPLLAYDLSVNGYVGLPLDWGTEYYGHLVGGVEEILSSGQEFFAPRRPDPDHPNATPGQRDFIRDIKQGFEDNYALMCVAPTGSGKTVCSLSASADIGLSTLAIVPTQVIMDQWIEAAHEFLGLQDEDIGIVQQNKCQYERPFCVGIINSVAKREYDPAFYNAFGTVWWDEAHRLGAPFFSKTMGLFNPVNRGALTATPDRRDGTAELFLKYFGHGQVVASAEALPIDVHVWEYREAVPEYVCDHITRIQWVSRSMRRNRWMADKIVKAWEQGRTILAVGDRIEQVERIRVMLEDAGIPAKDIGMFTNEFTDPNDGKRVKTSKEYLSWVKRVPNIVLGTYGMLKEGTDIPRLDWGMDLTPRTDAKQLIGRVRRPVQGKLKPEWHTTVDKLCGELVGYFQGRMRDYREDKTVRIIRHDQQQTGT